jgi:redox-sensitive bicupin YhaK (pirin superfamily)
VTHRSAVLAPYRFGARCRNATDAMVVRPGALNLMTAGNGIQHSEVSLPDTTVLHGAQLWISLPDATRHSAPFFERFVPEPLAFERATVSVFLGEPLHEQIVMWWNFIGAGPTTDYRYRRPSFRTSGCARANNSRDA